jgi:hypothetical protein
VVKAHRQRSCFEVSDLGTSGLPGGGGAPSMRNGAGFHRGGGAGDEVAERGWRGGAPTAMSFHGGRW